MKLMSDNSKVNLNSAGIVEYNYITEFKNYKESYYIN
jgi:hypothetical protein